MSVAGWDDGPRLRQRRVESVGYRSGSDVAKRTFCLPRLDSVVEPEPPAKRARAPKPVSLEALDPVRRPLLVDATHPSLTGYCCTEEHCGPERTELAHEAVSDGRLEVLGDFEAKHEVGCFDLTANRAPEVVFDRGDSRRRREGAEPLSIETAVAPSRENAEAHQPSPPPDVEDRERACTRSCTTGATTAALRADSRAGEWVEASSKSV